MKHKRTGKHIDFYDDDGNFMGMGTVSPDIDQKTINALYKMIEAAHNKATDKALNEDESIIIIIHSSFIASDNQKFRFDFLLDLKHYLEDQGVSVWSLGFEDFDNVKPFQISGAYDQTLSQDTIRRIHSLIIGFKTHALNGKYRDD